MKKIFMVCFILIIPLVFGGCKTDMQNFKKANPLLSHHLRMANPKAEKEYVTDYFNNIMESIEKEDALKLKQLFSKNIQESSNTLDEDIEYIFNFVEGRIEYKSEMEASSTSTDSKYGKKRSYIKCYFLVSTDVEEYMVFLKICNVDSYDKNNEGLRMLQIIKKADREKYFDWGRGKSACEGIFKPNPIEN